MTEKEAVTTGKYLSLLLRHEPGLIGLELNEQGWATIDELLEKWNGPVKIDKPTLELLVNTNPKKRFIIDETGTKIRANQGHSIQIDPGLAPSTPPDVLYHGTTGKFIEDIKAGGLRKMNRLHVHLSIDEASAFLVGQRKGKPVILEINARQMQDDGLVFYKSENDVWLTDAVAPHYIQFPV